MMRELAAVDGLRLNNDDDREGAIYTDTSGHKQPRRHEAPALAA